MIIKLYMSVRMWSQDSSISWRNNWRVGRVLQKETDISWHEYRTFKVWKDKYLDEKWFKGINWNIWIRHNKRVHITIKNGFFDMAEGADKLIEDRGLIFQSTGEKLSWVMKRSLPDIETPYLYSSQEWKTLIYMIRGKWVEY